MSEEIRAGMRVIHEGEEKEVTQAFGDILVVRGNSGEISVSPSDVSVVPQAEGQEEPEETVQQDATPEVNPEDSARKAELRRNIEDLNENTPVSALMRIMNDVDSNMVINTRVDWDIFKSDVIHRALDLNKIDPKICESCGQVIPE